MKIGDRVFVRGYIDEIRKDTVIIRNAGGYFGTIPSEVITGELPPAQPERKTGKWIDGKRMKNDGTFYWFRQCDQCGYERNDCDTEKDSNFCPDCGADMREGQDG